MYISCLLQCAYFLIGKKPVQRAICHVAPPYFLLYIVYIVEFTQLYTPEHARNEPPWLLLSGFCKHHYFAHTSSSLVLNAVQSDAGQEWLLGVQYLKLFCKYFQVGARRRLCNPCASRKTNSWSVDWWTVMGSTADCHVTWGGCGCAWRLNKLWPYSSFEGSSFDALRCVWFCVKDGRLPCWKLIAVYKALAVCCFCNCLALMFSVQSA